MKNELIEEKCQAFIKSLRELREKKEMSQQDLADRSGLKRPNISRIESGVYKPNLETIMRIVVALDIELILE